MCTCITVLAIIWVRGSQLPLCDQIFSFKNLQKQLHFLRTVDTLYPALVKQLRGLKRLLTDQRLKYQSNQYIGMNISDVATAPTLFTK